MRCFPLAVLSAAALLPVPCGASAAPPSGDASLPSESLVIAHVRASVGYAGLKRFPRGIVVREQDADRPGVPAEPLYFGPAGAVRSGTGFGFDGLYGWQYDERRRHAVPASQRTREKLGWPLWVRGHAWLDPRSGIQAAVDPAQSTGGEIALTLTRSDGLVPASLFVDRRTWLPIRLVVPYERGPFTQTYFDYRAVKGVLFAFRVASSYRTSGARIVSAVDPIEDASVLQAPPLPRDYRFDERSTVQVETTAGAPMGPGAPGHNYVRAAVEGPAGSRSGWWHFDSGSDSMIVDTAVADALGMEVIGTHRSMGADGNVREGTWRRARRFKIGGLTIEHPVFRAMDLSANNAPPGERRVGTIGYDLFARAVVEYADGGREVRICNPDTYGLPRGGRWQRLEHIDSTPAVRATVDGYSGLFQVDTGAAGTIDFARPFHEKHPRLGIRLEEVKSSGSGGTFAVQRGRVGALQFGGRTFRNLEVSFRTGGISREGSAGTIGRTVLAPFRTVFDYSHHRVAFLPLALGPGRCR